MDALEVLKQRRAVRSFEDKPIPKTYWKILLTAEDLLHLQTMFNLGISSL